jgi:hypothetical protein
LTDRPDKKILSRPRAARQIEKRAGIVAPCQDVGISFFFDRMAAALVLGYLLGTILRLVLHLASGAGDIRKVGSGNIGATNVLRAGKNGPLPRRFRATPPGRSGRLARPLFHFYDTDFAALGVVLGHLFRLAALQGRQGRGHVPGRLLGALLAGWSLGGGDWLGAAGMAHLVLVGTDRHRPVLRLFPAVASRSMPCWHWCCHC